MTMATRRVGTTPLHITEIGFGGAAIGNLYERVSNADALDAVACAYAHGIRYFDTAPLYGFGLSERRVGLALGEVPRDTYALSTKVGRRLRPTDPRQVDPVIFDNIPGAGPYFDYSYDGIMRSVEESLQRLGLHRADILLIHDVDNVNQGSEEATQRRFDEVMAGGYHALAKLRAEGTVAAIGVGINEWQWCERFARVAEFDCFLLAGRYTLLDQASLDTFLPLCEQKQISVIIGGPYNSGILATGPVPGARYDYAPAQPEILERVRRIAAVCARHGVELPAAALQFPLHHPRVASVIPGARSRAEVDRSVALYRTAIPAQLWQELKAEGLLRADAPTPGDPA
jgi:D-threo-aldose 1-dehydrogenase